MEKPLRASSMARRSPHRRVRPSSLEGPDKGRHHAEDYGVAHVYRFHGIVFWLKTNDALLAIERLHGCGVVYEGDDDLTVLRVALVAHHQVVAIKDAGIEKTAVEHINTHGTSTPQGDLAEIIAIKKVFGEASRNITLNSTKSMTGHLLGGTGAVEAIATIMALNKGIIPPTINHFEDDPQIDPDLDFAFNKARKRDIHYALSNAFGFGGQNTSLLFKKYTL